MIRGARILGGVLGLSATAAVSTLEAATAPRYALHEATTAEKIPLIVLRDETSRLEAAVAPTQGGELSGLAVEFQGRSVELLYRGRDYRPASGFRGKASILWPAVGSSVPAEATPVNGKVASAYDYRGKRYPMPQHGFARLKSWSVARTWTDATEAAVELVLKDDAETRAQYPFGFALHVIYRVTEGRVEIHHEVKAAADNTAPMAFSIGNHIGFAVPLLAGSSVESFAVESPSRFEYLRGKNGAPDGTTRERSFPPSTPLKDLQFMPAMSVGAYDGDPWFRLTDASGLGVKVTHHAQSTPVPPFVQFNLYGGTAEGFFCPEPFVGLHNSLNTQTGQIALAPGKSWSWLIRVELERVARK
jgi:galactose mutarotase-like enzyme